MRARYIAAGCALVGITVLCQPAAARIYYFGTSVTGQYESSISGSPFSIRAQDSISTSSDWALITEGWGGLNFNIYVREGGMRPHKSGSSETAAKIKHTFTITPSYAFYKSHYDMAKTSNYESHTGGLQFYGAISSKFSFAVPGSFLFANLGGNPYLRTWSLFPYTNFTLYKKLWAKFQYQYTDETNISDMLRSVIRHSVMFKPAITSAKWEIAAGMQWDRSIERAGIDTHHAVHAMGSVWVEFPKGFSLTTSVDNSWKNYGNRTLEERQIRNITRMGYNPGTGVVTERRQQYLTLSTTLSKKIIAGLYLKTSFAYCKNSAHEMSPINGGILDYPTNLNWDKKTYNFSIYYSF